MKQLFFAMAMGVALVAVTVPASGAGIGKNELNSIEVVVDCSVELAIPATVLDAVFTKAAAAWEVSKASLWEGYSDGVVKVYETNRQYVYLVEHVDEGIVEADIADSL